MESSAITGLARTARTAVGPYEAEARDLAQRRFGPSQGADARAPLQEPAATTPPDRIDGLVKSAAGTLTVARNLDVLADATEPEPHTLDVLA